MNIKYRKAKIEDVPFILDILNSVSGNVKDINSNQFLIAQDENKIIGCVRIQNIDGYFELASLAVLPDYRKRGIGNILVTKIIKENTKRPLYLFCNIKNEGFYKKLGFKRTEVKNIPEVLKKDYDNLLNLKFAKNTELLIVMILV